MAGIYQQNQLNKMMRPDQQSRFKRIYCRVLLLVALFLPVMPQTSHAQTEATELEPPFVVQPEEGGLRVQFATAEISPAAGSVQWRIPIQQYGGFMLPIQIITVRTDDNVSAANLQVEFRSEPWTGELAPAPVLQPPALDWEAPTWQAAPKQQALPAQPVEYLGAGNVRGQAYATYAFSELYFDVSGQPMQVTELDAFIPGATEQVQASSLTLDQMDRSVEAAVKKTVGGSGPSNPISTWTSITVHVREQGIQSVSGNDLAAAGFDKSDATNLRLFHQGVEVPLHVLDADGNGKLTGAESFRFYAEAPGDRWNEEDVYWLSLGSTTGLRMPTRNVSPSGAPPRSTAYEEGRWVDNHQYESAIDGPDRDHWFYTALTTEPNASYDSLAPVTATLSVNLPLSASVPLDSTYVVNGVALDNNGLGSSPIPHRLQLLGGTVDIEDSAQDWTVNFSTGTVQDFSRTIIDDGETKRLVLRLLPSAVQTNILIDSIAWQQPVALNFNSGSGIFRGVAGNWTYRLSQLATGSALYDVTEPQNPLLLATTKFSMLEFQDGPEQHLYALASPNALQKPTILPHMRPQYANLSGADVVYIAPKEFHQALQPLVAHRSQAGYQVAVVDVQEIYDGWSYGSVDANAIREFLRYIVDNWSPSPIAAVLVGDGTYDPHHFLGFDTPNVIPPFLANVDPWLGENACETCFAQLNGDDPLTEETFLTDIWVGRFPVISVEELKSVVSKILSYEANPGKKSAWQGISVQIADDWIIKNDSGDGYYKDSAGNFTYYVEQIAKLQPPDVLFTRHYYNAPVDYSQIDSDVRSWLEQVKWWIDRDEIGAQAKSKSLLNSGAGLVTFTGHSNNWMWGRMGPDSQADYDHRLYGLRDVPYLTNKDKLFVGLAMTCLSSRFTVPAPDHYTLDEHLFLHANGGAVAMWGPAGLSVASGHEALQIGFYNRLWNLDAAPGTTPIGALVQAGYNHVATTEPHFMDVVHTYVLLGDPLTPLRYTRLDKSYVPRVDVTKPPDYSP